MEVLQSQLYVKTLKEVVYSYFPGDDRINEVLNELGDILVAFEKSLVFPSDLKDEENLPWEDFKCFITFLFDKSGEKFLPNNSQSCGIPSRSMNIFHISSWKKLYEIIGTKLMKFLLRKCFMYIAVSPKSYMCLRDEHARQHFNKYQKQINFELEQNHNTVSKILKNNTEGYNRNQEISVMSAMYSVYHLNQWSKNAFLRKKISIIDDNCLNSVVNEILAQDVGVDLKEILKNDYENIISYLEDIRPFLETILIMVNSQMHYPFTDLYQKYINSDIKKQYWFNLTILKLPNNEIEPEEVHIAPFNSGTLKKLTKKRFRKLAKILPIPEEKVFKFIFKVLDIVIPKKLLGSSKNVKAFCNSITRLLKYGINVKLRLSDLVKDINIHDIKWLDKLPCTAAKYNVMAKLCLFLWNEFVKVLIYGNFYATEHVQYKNKIVYYEHGKWFRLKSMMIDNNVNDQVYSKIDELNEELKINTTATMRWIPKKIGARSILNIRRTADEKKSMKNVKIFLQQVNEIVKDLTRSMGSDIHLFHKEWLNLVNQVNASSGAKFYFVKVDIRDAYGSVRQELLLQCLDELLNDFIRQHETLKLVKYTCITLKKSHRVFSTLKRFESLPLAFPKRSIILNNSGSSPEEFNTQELIERLKGFVLYQTFKDSTHLYWIRQGISQGGSSLSSILCNIYYSALEAKHLLPFLQDSSNHLLRRVDDFVYITPNLELAKKFLATMREGFSDFRVFINESKTVTNIEVPNPNEVITVPFSGYLLNSNMQIRINFSSYSGVQMRHTINVQNFSNPGRLLWAKMSILSIYKLNKLTLDPTYNRHESIIQNIYEASMLMAFRFHALVKYFMVTYSSPLFLLKCIKKLAFKIASIVTIHTNVEGKSVISFSCVQWIVYKAFHVRLSQEDKVYEPVLHSLVKHLATAYKNVDKIELRTVVTKFKKIGIPNALKLIRQ